MMDRPCKVTRLEVVTENSDYYDPVFHSLIRENHDVVPIDPGYFYLGLSDIELSVVANAIVRLRDLDPVPTILSSSLDRTTGRFLETDLLELAACAEGIDRRMHEGDESPFDSATVSRIQQIAIDAIRYELHGPLGEYAAQQVRTKLQHFEPTYMERLMRLIEYTQACAPEAAGVAAKWARSLVDARNDYAHLLPGPRNSWETNMVLKDSLKWIIGAAILLHVGVDDKTIKAGLQRTESYAFFVRKSRNYAPEIYDIPLDNDNV
jgi:HEPN superfamily Apea-like protein